MTKRKSLKKEILPQDLAPLQRPMSLNNLAYESLKKVILTGELASGKIYSELELARRLGISRTPVREALLRLASENFVIFHSRKGMSVNYFNQKDIEDLFELRQAIEEAIISKLVGNLDKDQVQRARSIIAEQEKCIKNNFDENLFLEIDRKFHLFFIETCGNKFMTQTYNNIRNYMTIAARKALMKKGRVKEVIQEHKAILEALTDEDLEKAKEALRRHLNNSKQTPLENHFDNE